MKPAERHAVLQGWIGLVASLVQAHCLLWDHSPTYHAWAEKRRWQLRDWRDRWLRPPVLTVLRGRLRRDVEEALDNG